MRFTRFPILVFYSFTSFIIGCSHKTSAPQFKNGKEITSALDSLFSNLDTASSSAHPYAETLVETNEQIRRVIEHIDSPRMLDEIQTKYIAHEHDFSFILSSDRKIAVFSWQTHLENFGNRIKNIALYRSNDKMVPTSLYGSPFIYSDIHQIERDNSDIIYLLRGQDSLEKKRFYRLNTYLLKNGHLEEIPLFPNFKSSITFKGMASSARMGQPSGIEIKKMGQRIQIQDPMYHSLQQSSLIFDGKKYVYDKESN